MESFKSLESALDVLPSEALIASDAGPLFIIVARTNAVHTKVDGARATHAAAATVVNLAVVAVRLRRCLITPVHGLVHESGPSLTVDTQVTVFLPITCFQQQHRGL